MSRDSGRPDEELLNMLGMSGPLAVPPQSPISDEPVRNRPEGRPNPFPTPPPLETPDDYSCIDYVDRDSCQTGINSACQCIQAVNDNLNQQLQNNLAMIRQTVLDIGSFVREAITQTLISSQATSNVLQQDINNVLTTQVSEINQLTSVIERYLTINYPPIDTNNPRNPCPPVDGGPQRAPTSPTAPTTPIRPVNPFPPQTPIPLDPSRPQPQPPTIYVPPTSSDNLTWINNARSESNQYVNTSNQNVTNVTNVSNVTNQQTNQQSVTNVENRQSSVSNNSIINTDNRSNVSISTSQSIEDAKVSLVTILTPLVGTPTANAIANAPAVIIGLNQQQAQNQNPAAPQPPIALPPILVNALGAVGINANDIGGIAGAAIDVVTRTVTNLFAQLSGVSPNIFLDALSGELTYARFRNERCEDGECEDVNVSSWGDSTGKTLTEPYARSSFRDWISGEGTWVDGVASSNLSTNARDRILGQSALPKRRS